MSARLMLDELEAKGQHEYILNTGAFNVVY